MYIHRHIRSSTSLSDYKTLNSKRKGSKQCRLRQKTVRPHIKRSPQLKHNNRFSVRQMQSRSSQIIIRRSSGVFLLINTGLYLQDITPLPGVRHSKSRWTRQDLGPPTSTEDQFMQKLRVFSLSSVRGMICPDQTCISSDAIKTALWRLQDLAPDVCPFYGQTASDAYFSVSREVIQSRG